MQKHTDYDSPYNVVIPVTAF